MRVLFLTTQLPYPAHSGGVIKSYRLAEHLASRCELTVVCALKGRDEAFIKDFKEDIQTNEVVGIPINKERSARQLFQSYKHGKTLNEWRNYSADLEALILHHMHQADVILIDHYEMAQYVPSSCSTPVVLHTHNAEHLIWSRYSELLINPFKKLAGLLEAKRIQKAETEACQKAQTVLAAPDDIKALNKLLPQNHKVTFKSTYHLGNQAFLNLPELQFEKSRNAIFFFGTLSWHANLDGLTWFIKNVWPKLLRIEPKLVFYIIGKRPPLELKRLAKKHTRIVFTGFIEDLNDYFTQCRVMINPVRFGSGIKVKMLDAMYRGMPTVSSEIGTESLDLQHDVHVSVANTPGEWCEKISRLIHDEALWKTLSEHSRKLAAERYRWEPMLEAHWQEILKVSPQEKTEDHAV